MRGCEKTMSPIPKNWRGRRVCSLSHSDDIINTLQVPALTSTRLHFNSQVAVFLCNFLHRFSTSLSLIASSGIDLQLA